MKMVQNIRMGEIGVVRGSGTLRTLLGSCIGVVIQHPQARIAAMGHILLANSQGNLDAPGRYVDTAIPEIIRQLKSLARLEDRFVADISGGADMFNVGTERTVGRLNIAAVIDVLVAHRITIRSQDCGGKQGRRMAVDVATGLVTIERIPLLLPRIDDDRFSDPATVSV